MKTIFHSKNTRGQTDFGWLKANYSFSFANFYNPQRESFGKLRVLNDDIIAPEKGFGTHPHQNMEIISIPLQGSLAHKDSLNHESIIQTGDIQVMSAGTGILHSEYNPSKTSPCNLLQLWILPNKANVAPRYDQKSFLAEAEKNKFNTIVAPKNKVKDALWIHQNVYLKIARIDQGKVLKYQLSNTNNGIYAFVISGSLKIAETNLQEKDAIGIIDFNDITIEATADTRILIIETPV